MRLSHVYWSYKPEDCGFETRLGEFLNLPLSATLGPGVHSASNKNEYQKQKKNHVYGGVERGR
jgi:hypothetical protein